MRKLMALAIVLVFAGTTRSWALVGLGDVNFDGSLEVSGNSANNETDVSADNDHRGDTNTRLRLGMNAEVTEGVKGRLEAIRTPRLYGTAPTNLNGEQTSLVLHNAYLDLNLWDHMFRLGRQYVGNPGDLVWNISPKDDDGFTNNSIDGILIQCRKYDFLHLDVFTGKSSDDEVATSTDTDFNDTSGDVNLSSLDLTLPTLVPGGKINLGYLWGKATNTASQTDDNKLTTIRVGINGGISENFFTYRAEYLMNGGELETGATEKKYKGTAIDLGVGLNSAETGVGGFGIWANYLIGSGDDNNTDSDDESFHDFSRLGVNTSDRLMGEIFGKSNALGGGTPLGQGLDAFSGGGLENQGLTVINIGASYKPTMIEKTSIKLDWFSFQQSEDTLNNAAVLDDIGSEIDLTLGYAHSDNVNIEAGYAMLSPDDALTGGGTNPDEDITKLFARLKVKWGGEAQ